ncbi:TELO2-interacting protein 1 homolog [Anthonomus grandis grandis]|uniref:TELO2-interacting protein 1 homolog n=1 Tax=Anthonomus grandis grandis TaxID=2921223 RepID=UPI002166263B|nr:TELO2-interacting protein 1 homolog [Anthonomus grandis grandis]XP_050294399.1 TELO2-interacting protein 1 homolog [Anthonomus grandis grandis]XP_050294401.1 TELO2-interacting protein 1 homolog [Anthonomus grandis grandis]
MDSFKKYAALSALCKEITNNPLNLTLLEQLKEIVLESPNSFVQAAQKMLVVTFFPYLKSGQRLNEQGKLLLIETMAEFFSKTSIENSNLFFNFYTFILLELYDYKNHIVLGISEEYKSALLNCMIALVKSVSSETLKEIYSKENVSKLSQIIYVCAELAKNETARHIRSLAITCIMAIAKVTDTDDQSDVVLRNKCADMFMFFLPALSSTLPEIALKDSAVGHSLPVLATKAYGRIIAVIMQDYRPSDQILDVEEVVMWESKKSKTLKAKFKDKKEIDLYLNSTVRNALWYKETDEKINITFKRMDALTYHSNVNLRMEIVDAAAIIIKNCSTTIPQSVGTLIEYLIILSEDSDPVVAEKSRDIINNISKDLSTAQSLVFENVKERFCNAINSLPRKFNSIDDAEKVAALNLLIGYIHLFGEQNLSCVLLSPSILDNLLQGLLYISEIKKSNISLLEEYSLKDLNAESVPNWINFQYFNNDNVRTKLNDFCAKLAKHNCFELVHDYLYDIYLNVPSKRNEAVYLTNFHITGLEDTQINKYWSLIKNIINIYTEDHINDLNAALDSEEYSVEMIQSNIILICLLTEGLGRISLTIGSKFQNLLLKTLYVVLEKAGSGHPLIKRSGLFALKNITQACGYVHVTDLINANFDFFSYHVQRKLGKLENKEGVLNVLSVVLQYSNVDVLLPMRNIFEEVFLNSCDMFKDKYATAYLKVFRMFIQSLKRWFQIEVVHTSLKSRQEKEQEHEHFQVSGINYDNNFSDDIMEGRTAEELYKEDMEKQQKIKEISENDEGPLKEAENEYQKPKPEIHVELTHLILKRSVHFLPSKNDTRKILVLEILENGLELLRDSEDELLPVVHLIWNPLLQRFKADTDPLIMRLATRLVATMARLAKEFIRARFVKELLPKFIEILSNSAKESHLKDKGSSYRYSQDYKLQHEMLQHIGLILYNLDVEEETIIKTADAVCLYLSDKQPHELQVAAVDFFQTMWIYDARVVNAKLECIANTEEYLKNLTRIKAFIDHRSENN